MMFVWPWNELEDFHLWQGGMNIITKIIHLLGSSTQIDQQCTLA